MRRPIDWSQEPCPYCDGVVIYTSNKALYGKEYGNGRCYMCTECGAHVGVHSKDGRATHQPLGIMATHTMSKLKISGHTLFDRAWKSRAIKRQTAYRRLAKAMGINKRRCHFGWFNETNLRHALEIVSRPKWWEEYR